MNKKPVSYKQYDSRWKDIPYEAKGESQKRTIGSSGCAPTSACMLIETITGKTFTPKEACEWSLAHGYKAANQGTYYSYFKPQFAEYGIECDMLNWTNTYGKPNHSNHDKVVEMLKEGYYFIALMGKGLWTTGGHFVVLWWSDDKVRINDPISAKECKQNGDIATFRNEVCYYWWIDAREFNNPTTTKKEEITLTNDEVIVLIQNTVSDAIDENKQERENVYETINDVPDYYKEVVQSMIDDGSLKGVDEHGTLNVNETFCRIMTVLHRKGIV